VSLIWTVITFSHMV